MNFVNEIPWTIVAMIFIAFISWVYNKVQEVSAERRRRRFQKVKQSYDKQEQRGGMTTPAVPEERPKSVIEQAFEAMTGTSLEEMQRQQQEAEEEERRREALKRKAEQQRQAELQRQREQQQQQRSNAPPPLPGKVGHSSEPQIVVPQPRKKFALPTTNVARKKQKKRVATLRDLLRGQDSLRQALIASEVLHKPKALEDKPSRPF